MIDRLNGWQRIGVVLTALWLGYVLVLAASSTTGTGLFGETIPGVTKTVVDPPEKCPKNAPEHPPGDNTFSLAEAYGCTKGVEYYTPVERTIQVTPERHQFKYKNFAIAATLPPLLSWLFVYLLVWVVKWIAKGFRSRAT